MDTNVSRSLVARLVCSSILAAIIAAPVVADEQPDRPSDQKPDSSALGGIQATLPVLPAGTSDPVTLAFEPTISRTIVLAAVNQSDSLIGVELAAVGDVLRSHLGLGDGTGLIVTSVADDSPAAQAGIQKNDVLVTVGGQEIAGADALRKSLEASVEKPIAFGLIRAGKKQSVDVTPRSTTVRLFTNALNHVVAEPKYRLGLGLAGADDTLRSQLALPAGEGLVVTSIDNDSPAAKAGVMVNDVLLKLDGKALSTIEALAEQLQTIADKSVALELLRRAKPATLTVTPEKRADAWQTVQLLDDRDVIFVTPQQVELGIATFASAIGTEAPNLTSTQAKTDLVRQISELEAQIKQLEASLAAIRAAIDPPASPAPNSGEKKDDK
ncbi:MAG TPA: PDZ domain-containing protein [Pirellulales bacterium]|jgi:membrane-associated protease RseP (regulator of RpoE activity)|nr:PDZ domain-containing protein [Pirellulales bacterium]